MYLNREQTIAFRETKKLEFEPVQAIILTSKHSKTKLPIVSISAIKDGERYNLRMLIDSANNIYKTNIDKLTTIIDYEKSEDVTDIDKCYVTNVKRTPTNFS